MIVQLADGQSAELRERLAYQQGRDLRAAFIEVKKDEAAFADLPMALVHAYVSSWHVLDLEGKAVPIDHPELAPWDIIEAISVEAMNLWSAAEALPKDGSAALPSMPPVPRSRRRTRR